MSLATEAFLGMIQDNRDFAAARDFQQLQAIAESLANRATAAEEEVAGLHALLAAVERVLAAVLPSNSLLADQAVRDKIYADGVTACRKTNSYGAAQEVGRAFDLPDKDRKQLQTVLDASQRATKASVEERAASSLAMTALADSAKQAQELEATRRRLAELGEHAQMVEGKLTSVVRDCAGHMALAAAFREELSKVRPESPLLLEPGLRNLIAKTAYAKLEASDPVDWGIVREVGKNWANLGATGEAER